MMINKRTGLPSHNRYQILPHLFLTLATICASPLSAANPYKDADTEIRDAACANDSNNPNYCDDTLTGRQARDCVRVAEWLDKKTRRRAKKCKEIVNAEEGEGSSSGGEPSPSIATANSDCTPVRMKRGYETLNYGYLKFKARRTKERSTGVFEVNFTKQSEPDWMHDIEETPDTIFADYSYPIGKNIKIKISKDKKVSVTNLEFCEDMTAALSSVLIDSGSNEVNPNPEGPEGSQCRSVAEGQSEAVNEGETIHITTSGPTDTSASNSYYGIYFFEKNDAFHSKIEVNVDEALDQTHEVPDTAATMMWKAGGLENVTVHVCPNGSSLNISRTEHHYCWHRLYIKTDDMGNKKPLVSGRIKTHGKATGSRPLTNFERDAKQHAATRIGRCVRDWTKNTTGWASKYCASSSIGAKDSSVDFESKVTDPFEDVLLEKLEEIYCTPNDAIYNRGHEINYNIILNEDPDQHVQCSNIETPANPTKHQGIRVDSLCANVDGMKYTAGPTVVDRCMEDNRILFIFSDDLSDDQSNNRYTLLVAPLRCSRT